MKLSEHFSLAELTASDYASRNGISNEPSEAVIPNLKRLASTLERIRALLGYPIHINSGYRSGAVNKAVGGKPTSLHCQGLAVDLTCKDYGTPFDVCVAIEASGIEYDKLILEFYNPNGGGWVHIQLGKENRRQNFTVNSFGTHTGFRI